MTSRSISTALASVAAAFCPFAIPAAAQAQAEPVTITDGRGVEITFPLGTASFADRVTNYSPGGTIPDTAATNPEGALALPDYSRSVSGTFVTLGCGGQATWEFTDNVLIDVPGPDLWIFEIGPDVEGTAVEVSADGASWVSLGAIEGATAGLDLAGHTAPGDAFRFVRLTDDGIRCSGRTPGADIDAIGAIGAQERIDNGLPAEGFGNAAEYDDTRGGLVRFPAGDISFADAVVAYAPGNGIEPGWDDPTLGLNAPDYEDTSTARATTLGCGGSVIYQFTDNTLIDVPGPDLFIFEVGPDVEGTSLAISGDGTNWVEIGAIQGATAAIDIAPFITPGDTFQFVRLVDDALQCSGRFPGADIDAVGAIGSATRLVLDANLLFDFDSADLRPAAVRAIAELAQAIKSGAIAQVVVDGHTDAQGSDDYNLGLSRARATSVMQSLIQAGVPQGMLTSRAFGEGRPVADNATDAGRQAHRRVEVLLIRG